MIRPEALAALKRWAEPGLVGAGALFILWMLWPGATRGDWASILGALIAALGGGAWFWAALNRARLSTDRARSGGQVIVEERRILYLGPLGVAEAILSELTRVEIATGKTGMRIWMLSAAGKSPVAIPDTAENAEGVLDALCALPGFNAGAAARARGPLTVVWRRPDGPF